MRPSEQADPTAQLMLVDRGARAGAGNDDRAARPMLRTVLAAAALTIAAMLVAGGPAMAAPTHTKVAPRVGKYGKGEPRITKVTPRVYAAVVASTIHYGKVEPRVKSWGKVEPRITKFGKIAPRIRGGHAGRGTPRLGKS